MAGYGTHPTQYGNLTDSSLYAMYRTSVFSSLSETQKLDLLQETVNRDAREWKELGAPQVVFASLPPNISGTAANGIITINKEMVVEQRQSFTYQGKTVTHPLTAANLECLNTIFHENTHCWQDQIIDGTIPCQQKALLPEYQANTPTASPMLINGKYTLGSQYMTGVTPSGYYCYYFQATERDAYLAAELKTNQIQQFLTEKYGMEKSFADYQNSIRLTGYRAMEQEAIQTFQNPNFEKDVNNTLKNQFFGTNIPVNPATEQAVKKEMAATYQEYLNKSLAPSQLEDKNMPLNHSITLEEYNASLRSTVNAYYTHAINNPSISREEAIPTEAPGAALQIPETIPPESIPQENLSQDSSLQETSSLEASLPEAEASVGEDAADGGLEGEGCDDGIEI